MRRRFALSYDEQLGYYVNLPHYQMVPGSHEPIIKGVSHKDGILPSVAPADALKHGMSVLCDMPDGIELDTKGGIDAKIMRNRYPSDAKHGDRAYTPPKILGER